MRLDFNALRLIKPAKFVTMKESNDELPVPLTAKELILLAIKRNKGISTNALYDLTGLADSTVSLATKTLLADSLITRRLGSGNGNGKSAYFSAL